MQHSHPPLERNWSRQATLWLTHLGAELPEGPREAGGQQEAEAWRTPPQKVSMTGRCRALTGRVLSGMGQGRWLVKDRG